LVDLEAAARAAEETHWAADEAHRAAAAAAAERARALERALSARLSDAGESLVDLEQRAA